MTSLGQHPKTVLWAGMDRFLFLATSRALTHACQLVVGLEYVIPWEGCGRERGCQTWSCPKDDKSRARFSKEPDFPPALTSHSPGGRWGPRCQQPWVYLKGSQCPRHPGMPTGEFWVTDRFRVTQPFSEACFEMI